MREDIKINDRASALEDQIIEKLEKVYDTDVELDVYNLGLIYVNTGHLHPQIVAAVEDQLKKLSHTCFQVLAYAVSADHQREHG